MQDIEPNAGTSKSQSLTLLGEEAFNMATSWLLERYPADVDRAIKSRYYESPEQIEASLGLPQTLQEAVDLNITEWLLAEGSFERSEDSREVDALEFGARAGRAEFHA